MSHLWAHVTQMKLSKNERSTDPAFSKFLLLVGSNVVPHSIPDPEWGPLQQYTKYMPIPSSMVSSVKNLGAFINEMFPDINAYDHSRPVSILTPKNVDKRLINDKCFAKFQSRQYPSSISVDSARAMHSDIELNIPPETLANFNPSGMPPHILKFKKSAPYVCLKNVNLPAGLCNGTRLELLGKSRFFIHVKSVHNDKEHFIPRFMNIDNDTFGLQLRRKQFPVQLAYAMSINKAQVPIYFIFFYSYFFLSNVF